MKYILIFLLFTLCESTQLRIRGCPGSGTTIITRALRECTDYKIYDKAKHKGCSLDTHAKEIEDDDCLDDCMYGIIVRSPYVFKHTRKNSTFLRNPYYIENLQAWNDFHSKWYEKRKTHPEKIHIYRYESIRDDCMMKFINSTIQKLYISKSYMPDLWSDETLKEANRMLDDKVMGHFDYKIEL